MPVQRRDPSNRLPAPPARPSTGSPPRLPRSIARSIPRSTVALIIALLLGLAGVAPVVAGPIPGGWHTGAGVAGTGYFVGQYRTAEGLIAYCTDVERLPPDRASAYSDASTGPFVRSDGSRLSADDNAALAFVLDRWGATDDDEEAAAVQLAVWTLTAIGMGRDTQVMTDFAERQQLAPAIMSRARALVNQARKEAGPYSISASYSPDDTGGRINASVISADGTARSGQQVRAVVEGGLFQDGSTTAEWVSTADAAVLAIERTGFGPGRITITAPTVPAPDAAWLTPRERDVQRLVVAPVSAEAEASVDLPGPTGFSPEVATVTSAIRTVPGSAVHDVLEVSVAPGGRWLMDPVSARPVELDVVSTLWGPLPTSPTEGTAVPAGTPALGTVTTAVTGPGTYQTPALVVSGAGYYVWTETIASSSARPEQASALVTPWSGTFGLPAETTLVPWQPTLSTSLTRSSARPGAVVRDTVTANGFNPADPGGGDADVVTLTLYGPLQQLPGESPDVPAETPIHSEIAVPAVNGSTISGDFARLEDPGCYTVVASFEGSPDEEPFRSAFGIPAETVCVETPPAFTPQLSTERPAPPTQAAPAAPPAPAALAALAPEPAAAAPPAASRPELAQTGMSAGVMGGVALMAVGLGLGLRTLARRRDAR